MKTLNLTPEPVEVVMTDGKTFLILTDASGRFPIVRVSTQSPMLVVSAFPGQSVQMISMSPSEMHLVAFDEISVDLG